MPGKSRRQKERKINKAAAVSEQLAAAVAPGLTVTVNGPAPTVKSSSTVKYAPVSASAAAAARATAVASPFIKRELLTIGLMTGIMLVVVIVLSIVLR
jgi:hypothetical protein